MIRNAVNKNHSQQETKLIRGTAIKSFMNQGEYKGQREMLVEVREVTKSFYNKQKKENFVSLENVSLFCDQNEFICLLGPSGCGKSTLLKLIAGLQTSDSGDIKIDGREIGKPTGDVGVVFQDYALFPWLTVRKNIGIGLEIRHMPQDEREEKVNWAIRTVHLEQFADYYPNQLSGGMKQRVAIARALVLNCRLLLMDEPFGALDAFTRMNLQDDLIDLWQNNKFACVFVTHDVDEAVYLADKVVVMTASPGKIKKVFDVPMGRPRVRTSDEFTLLRNRILAEYGYVDHRNMEYQI